MLMAPPRFFGGPRSAVFWRKQSQPSPAIWPTYFAPMAISTLFGNAECAIGPDWAHAMTERPEVIKTTAYWAENSADSRHFNILISKLSSSFLLTILRSISPLRSSHRDFLRRLLL